MYFLFISHSWNYSDAYEKLISLLRNANYFEFKDYSVPRDRPLIVYNQQYYENELRNKIESKMKYCHVVLVLAGVYASYSDSIKMEIEIAKKLGKPILAIEPFSSENTSTFVKSNAKEIVRWSTSSIVDAIRRLSR